MVAFGLILVVLSGLLAAAVLLSNTDPVVASAFGVSLSNVSLGEFFLIGTGVGVVFALGLAVAAGGAKRRRTKRKGLRDEVEAERSERELLEEQNALLRDQLHLGGRRDTVPPAEPVLAPEPVDPAPVGQPQDDAGFSPSLADGPAEPSDGADLTGPAGEADHRHAADEQKADEFPR